MRVVSICQRLLICGRAMASAINAGVDDGAVLSAMEDLYGDRDDLYEVYDLEASRAFAESRNEPPHFAEEAITFVLRDDVHVVRVAMDESIGRTVASSGTHEDEMECLLLHLAEAFCAANLDDDVHWPRWTDRTGCAHETRAYARMVRDDEIVFVRGDERVSVRHASQGWEVVVEVDGSELTTSYR